MRTNVYLSSSVSSQNGRRGTDLKKWECPLPRSKRLEGKVALNHSKNTPSRVSGDRVSLADHVDT